MLRWQPSPHDDSRRAISEMEESVICGSIDRFQRSVTDSPIDRKEPLTAASGAGKIVGRKKEVWKKKNSGKKESVQWVRRERFGRREPGRRCREQNETSWDRKSRKTESGICREARLRPPFRNSYYRGKIFHTAAKKKGGGSKTRH